MNEMCILDRTGDTKIIFDPSRPDEVENAKATFDRMKNKGYIAYRVNERGDKAEIMREFDATAGKIILAPALVGG